MSHKCLSASTFTVPSKLRGGIRTIGVTNAYRQVHLLYETIAPKRNFIIAVTNAYRQVHLLYRAKCNVPSGSEGVTNAYRQVHLLYGRRCRDLRVLRKVTNAYRQVHLLYDTYECMIVVYQSQMPIGKYIYCTRR